MGSVESRSFEEAFDRLFTRAVRVGLRILGDLTAAEDVGAETLARAHLHWRRLASSDYQDAWVVRTATNLAIDVARKRRAISGPTITLRIEESTVLRVTLVQALKELPKRQREAIALRYLCDLSEAETADTMRVAVGTVKATVHKGLESLRAILGANLGEGIDEAH